MHRQISEYFETIKISMWLQKRLSISHGSKLQKCILDQGKENGALLTDLSKAFDCLLHDLIFAKLHAYGFQMNR